MELIEQILSQSNLKEAIRRVKINKGAPGVDKKTVDELDGYFKKHQAEIKDSIMKMKYCLQAVRRVYIPKANGKKRPLGIPTVVDRVIQQAIAQILTKIYDPHFSANSYGFRPNRSAHDAINQVLEYLNDGYQWVIDLDIEKYFDTVNHDKLISIIREQVNDKITLHLIRAFLKAGIMEDGLVKPNKLGVPQVGPLSPILSNIYLDQFDQELEQRGLHFVRYADDCNIFVKSEKSADRVMKQFLTKFGQWLRHKVRLVIIKQWKLPRRIYTNLMRINKVLKYNFSKEDIHKTANTRLGWYKRSTGNVINFLLSPKVLGIRKADRPGLVDII